MGSTTKDKRGVRVFISNRELEQLDLNSVLINYVKQLIKMGKSNFDLENRIKSVESQLSEISDNLNRFIKLSSEVYFLFSQVSTIDQYEIERLKFYIENNHEISDEEVSMVNVSLSREKNFKNMLKNLFPDLKVGILKMMKEHKPDD